MDLQIPTSGYFHVQIPSSWDNDRFSQCCFLTSNIQWLWALGRVIQWMYPKPLQKQNMELCAYGLTHLGSSYFLKCCQADHWKCSENKTNGYIRIPSTKLQSWEGRKSFLCFTNNRHIYCYEQSVRSQHSVQHMGGDGSLACPGSPACEQDQQRSELGSASGLWAAGSRCKTVPPSCGWLHLCKEVVES